MQKAARAALIAPRSNGQLQGRFWVFQLPIESNRLDVVQTFLMCKQAHAYKRIQQLISDFFSESSEISNPPLQPVLDIITVITSPFSRPCPAAGTYSK